MGATVTVCGPPTLIPRQIEALGCSCETTLAKLHEADVVYVLRMQHERMHEAYVPTLREYAQRYQVNLPRLRAGQLLMHPGPVNRGVELSGEAIDSDVALIGAQVKSGRRGADGGPLRAAGRRPGAAGGGLVVATGSTHEKLFHAPGATGRAADPPGARARPAHGHRRAARRPDP